MVDRTAAQEIVVQIKESPGRKRSFASAFPVHHRVLMLLINYYPLMHVITIGCVLGVPWTSWGWRMASGLVTLYVLPPFTARALRLVLPIREGRIPLGSREYFTWWALSNLQMVFCRLPFLEEFLRLIPGLNSMWLRLWGARIGRLTYWGAGLRILDRSYLSIGDDVVFGAAVRLNAHVLTENDNGELELILATITVGNRVVVGGYSLLTAGTRIAPDQCTKAFLISPPFGHWKDGVRIRKTDSPL